MFSSARVSPDPARRSRRRLMAESRRLSLSPPPPRRMVRNTPYRGTGPRPDFPVESVHGEFIQKDIAGETSGCLRIALPTPP